MNNAEATSPPPRRRRGLDPTLSRDILKLALPVVLAMLTQTAINIMDTVMVGWLDPSYSIAGQSALGYSLPLLWLVGGFLSAISVGTLAIAARRFGEDNETASGMVASNSIFVAATTGLVFSVLAFFAVPYVFPLLNDNESVVAFGVPYSQVRLLGVLSMVTTIAYKSFFDGIGKTHIHMWAAMVMNVANIVLNYSLIFGVGPFPRLYVFGAGIASLISTYIGLAVMVAWSFKGSFRKRFNYYRLKNLKAGLMGDIVKLSLPSGFATIFVMLGFLVFFKVVGDLDAMAVGETLATTAAYGGEHVKGIFAFQHTLFGSTGFGGRVFSSDIALMTIEARPPIYSSATKVITDILSVTFMSAMAFGTATATLVSQSMGRKDTYLAESYGWESTKLGVLVFGTLGLISFIWPEAVMGLLSQDASVIEAGVPPMRLMAAIEWLIAIALILTQALFGAGNTKFVMWVEMILHVVCLIPLAYLFGIVLKWGMLGVWSSVATYIVLLAIIMAWKFRSGDWKHIEV